MKITEDNITQLKNYWGNRTVKDIIPSEMKITVSDVREWFNGFLNENGKCFKSGKIFYKAKGLTNFNRRVGIGYATYYPFLWMDYGRKGFEASFRKTTKYFSTFRSIIYAVIRNFH